MTFDSTCIDNPQYIPLKFNSVYVYMQPNNRLVIRLKVNLDGIDFIYTLQNDLTELDPSFGWNWVEKCGVYLCDTELELLNCENELDCNV